MTADRSPRILEIDVLRGLAALAVLVFHAQFVVGFSKFLLPPITLGHRVLANVPNVLSLGGSGVSLFFVVSGFCLALQNLKGRLDIGLYFRNRFARIVPTYWLALALSSFVASMLHGPGNQNLGWDLLVHSLFLHGFSGLHIMSLNATFWSMATEVQFYVAFPALLAAYRAVGGARFVAATGLLNVAWRVLGERLPAAAEMTGNVEFRSLFGMQLPGRIWEFALGMYLADLFLNRTEYRRHSFGVLAAFAIPLAAFVRLKGPKSIAEMLLGLMYFGLAGWWLFRSRTRPSGAMHGRPMRLFGAFGRSSYSFFLIHLPVLELVALGLRLDGSTPSYRGLAELLGCALPISVLIGATVYRTFELPMWKLLRRSTTGTSPRLRGRSLGAGRT